MAKITFTQDAIEDLEQLDSSGRRLVLGKLRMLDTNAEAGQPLGSRKLVNLTGLRKLVAGNRTYRIIYRVEKDGSVVVIWVIADRVDDECYELAIKRLEELGNHPVAKDVATAVQQMRPGTAKDVTRIRPGWK